MDINKTIKHSVFFQISPSNISYSLKKKHPSTWRSHLSLIWNCRSCRMVITSTMLDWREGEFPLCDFVVDQCFCLKSEVWWNVFYLLWMLHRVSPEEEKFLQHKSDGKKTPQFTDVSTSERQRPCSLFLLHMCCYTVPHCTTHSNGQLLFQLCTLCAQWWNQKSHWTKVCRR